VRRQKLWSALSFSGGIWQKWDPKIEKSILFLPPIHDHYPISVRGWGFIGSRFMFQILRGINEGEIALRELAIQILK
jgi:hypothetical protein